MLLMVTGSFPGAVGWGLVALDSKRFMPSAIGPTPGICIGGVVSGMPSSTADSFPLGVADSEGSGPITAVFGRNSDAITIRCVRNELIAPADETKRANWGEDWDLL